MNDNNIQNLINLYKSGKFSIAEKKVIKLIKKEPNNFFYLIFLVSFYLPKKNWIKRLLIIGNQ